MNDTVTMKSLADVCDILDSQRIPVTARDRVKGCYPYYGANGIQDYVDKYIFDDELVLLAEDGGNFGSKESPIAYRVSGKCWVNNHAHVLKPHDNTDVDYLCYALMFYNTEGLVNGATRQKLTQSAMKKMMIPFCDLKRQQEIVNELNAVSHLISLRQRQAEKLDELAKARFVEMFGDPVLNCQSFPVRTIGELTTEVKYGTSKPAVEGGKYPYLRMNNLTIDGKLDLHDLKQIDVDTSEFEKCVVRKGDVLFNRTNSAELVGKTAYYGLDEEMIIAGYIIRVRVNNLILPQYLSFYMNMPFMKQRIRSMAKGAVNQANINSKELKSIKVIVPPLEVQGKVVEYEERIDREKDRIQRSAALLETLKRSLMQQYFG